MIESIPYVLTGIGIIVSILYYISVLKNTNKARQRELILLRSQTLNKEYAEAYARVVKMDDFSSFEDFQGKYGPRVNPEAWADAYYIRSIFNTAGLLLMEKEADPDLIFQLYAPNSIIPIWEQFEVLVKGTREKHGHPDHWKPFEYLYNEARKRYPEISLEKVEAHYPVNE